MRRLLEWSLASGLALSLSPALFAQRPDLDFINQEIANEISRLEQLLGPGPTDVTASMGPMPNGGNCTLQIIVRSKNDPSQYYTYTVPYVDDDKCKNYHLEEEPDGSIKVVPNADPNSLTQDELADLQALLQFLGGGHVTQPQVAARSTSESSPQATPAASTTGLPEVLDLPFAPPLTAGKTVTAANGCETDQTYRIFRVDHFDNSVTRYDGCPMKITASIPIVATRPLQAALTPDNATLIVTSYDQGITFIDTATNKVTKTLFTSGDTFPSGIAIRSDGLLAYVTSLIDTKPQVLVLDVVNRAIVGKIPITVAYPHSVYFSPDGTTALVTCPITNYVFVIDVLTSTVSTAIQIGKPRDVAFNRTGTRAYVSSGVFPSSIKVVETSGYQVIDSYNVDGFPGYLQLSADGRILTAMDLNSAKKWIIDLATRNIVTVNSVVAGGGLTSLP